MSAGQGLFFATLAAALVLGFVVGRWRLLLIPLAVWVGIGIFLRENNGWHGAGWGDFGIVLNVIWAALTVLSTAIGIGLRRGLARQRDHAAA